MSIFSPKLGIDLGTANTLVYIPGRDVVLNEPSVVAVSEHDNSILAIGAEAREMIGRTPESIIAYRPLRDGVIADYRITEAMLRYYINKALGKFNLFKPDVMISVPAGVTSTERRAVIEAALKAGAGQAFVVKEPILAAIGAGIPIYEPQGNMIVDIGGGTTDVAIISLGGIVSCTSVKVGGTKIDAAITDYIKREFNLGIGDKTAEQVKIKVGGAVLRDDELETTIKGRDYITGLPRSIKISTNEVVKAIDDELAAIVKAVRDVLQDTPPELVSDIIDTGITMTGGSSQLRNLTDLLYRKTGVKARLATDPMLCVAKGTGIALEHLGTYRRSIMQKKRYGN